MNRVNLSKRMKKRNLKTEKERSLFQVQVCINSNKKKNNNSKKTKFSKGKMSSQKIVMLAQPILKDLCPEIITKR